MLNLGHALDRPLPPVTPNEEAAAPTPAPPPVPSAVETPARPRTVEDAVREGQIPLDNAAAAGKLFANPAHVKTGEDPVAEAMTSSATRMQKRVRRREEEGEDHPAAAGGRGVCSRHHVLFDAGRTRFLLWHDGHPVLADSRGRIITEAPAFLAKAVVPGANRPDRSALGTGPLAERPPPARAWRGRGRMST